MSFSDVLSNSNIDFLKLSDSHARSNATNLVKQIKSLVSMSGATIYNSNNFITAFCDHYTMKFCQCFKEEYYHHFEKIKEPNVPNCPRVLRSVSENNDVFDFDGGINFSNDNLNIDNTSFTKVCQHKVHSNGSTSKDNNRSQNNLSSTSINFPRRLSAGDVHSRHTSLSDFESSKKNKKKFLKRGMSFQGTLSGASYAKKEEANNQNEETASKSNIVASVWNRLRRGSYSRQVKVRFKKMSFLFYFNLTFVFC